MSSLTPYDLMVLGWQGCAEFFQIFDDEQIAIRRRDGDAFSTD